MGRNETPKPIYCEGSDQLFPEDSDHIAAAATAVAVASVRHEKNESMALLAAKKLPLGKHRSSTRGAVSWQELSDNQFDLWLEAKLLFDVAVPTMMVEFSLMFVFPQTASLLGRKLGTEELAGFSLSSLTGNLVFLSFISGALTAAETLQPRALGLADYEEVGRLAIRGAFACVIALALPMILILLFMDTVMDFLGQELIASRLAFRWIRIYALCVPAAILYRVTLKFLAAQGIVMPMVYSGLFGCLVFHPLALRIFVHFWGFEGSAVAVVSSKWVMAIGALVILRYTKPFHPQTWPGLSYNYVLEAIEIQPLLRFLSLGFGGVFCYSEWWFWESVCFIAGRCGLVSFAVHSIAYSIGPIFFMACVGLGCGLTVRIGIIIATDEKHAQMVAFVTAVFAVALVTVMSLALHVFRSFFMRLYTDDEEVLAGCERIWWKLCAFVAGLSMYGINGGILRALGLQWKMAAVLVTVLWFLSLPVMYYTAVLQGGGLDAIWTVLPISYAVLNVGLIVCYVTADWKVIGESLRARSMVGDSTG